MPENVMGSSTVTGVERSGFGVHVYIQSSRNGESENSTAFFSDNIYENTSSIYEYFESIIGNVYRDGEEVSQDFDATFTGDGGYSAADLGLYVHYFEGVLGGGGNGLEPGPSFAEKFFGVVPWDVNGGASDSFSSLSAGNDFFF
jgi:hypothetical protein